MHDLEMVEAESDMEFVRKPCLFQHRGEVAPLTLELSLLNV
jgi:hypothetical protein